MLVVALIAFQVTGTMAGLQWALLLFAVPMYVFCRQILALTSTYGPMKRLVAES
jgi:hypothetical protein